MSKTYADHRQELHDAGHVFFFEFAKMLRIPQMLDWLTRLLEKRYCV